MDDQEPRIRHLVDSWLEAIDGTPEPRVPDIAAPDAPFVEIPLFSPAQAGRPIHAFAPNIDHIIMRPAESCELELALEWDDDVLVIRYQCNNEPPNNHLWAVLVDGDDTTVLAWLNLGPLRESGGRTFPQNEIGFSPTGRAWKIGLTLEDSPLP